MLFIHETFLVYKLETFKNCKEVKHIMIMVIAIIYIFFILCDIWSTVENYSQKILRLPLKKSTPSFLLTPFPHFSAERRGRTLCHTWIVFNFLGKMKNEVQQIQRSATKLTSWKMKIAFFLNLKKEFFSDLYFENKILENC